MGNCVCCQLSCDQTVNDIVRCLIDEGYIRTIVKNLKALERGMEDLKVRQGEVKNKVAIEERQGRQRREAVKVWLTRVNSIDVQFQDVLSTKPIQLQKLCFYGLFSKNVCSSYKYGKRVFLLLEEVQILKSEGGFEVVAELIPTSGVEERPTQPTVGHGHEDHTELTPTSGVEERPTQPTVGHEVVTELTPTSGVEERPTQPTVGHEVVSELTPTSGVEERPTHPTVGHEVVTELTPTSGVEERPTHPTVGHEEILETAWTRLMEDGVRIMGLHGMGGVGKTTLFKKINNKFAEIPSRFEIVIWAVVSQGAQISKLQEDIAEKLNLFNKVWKNKNESNKASDIYRVLKGKRFVLMLDDIWEKVDLEAIGVPFPTRENGCKVAFTTRSRDVCGSMGDHEPMEVKCLEWNKAWELFQNKVGDNTLSPNIVEQAKKVAKKCRGLPLALNVIGETMAAKTTVQEWDHAINVLTRSATEFSNMDDKILPILKLSYDSLKDEHIKLCFLYCALFPEDYKISKEKLIDYWICEGFIGEDDQDTKTAMNKGYDVLGTFIRAHLVMEIGTTAVVMHDVIREMALWIASNFGKQKETFIVKAKVGLDEIPKVKDWGAVRRMSLMDNDIKEITCASKCSELTTLLLQYNRLENLSGEFIQSMQKLVVLDLSHNVSIYELPEQISELTSLQFLDLSSTSIEQLPVGFQKLEKLTQLNLTDTDKLCSLSGISKLSSLRILKLLNSKVHGDVSLLKELQLLEHLQVLTITISTELGLKQLIDDPRLANCTKALRIWETNFSDLQNPTRPCFTHLTSVDIYKCNGIKDLTWLLFAPNLVYLKIHNSNDVEDIINKEKATNLTGNAPFQKLEKLVLNELPKLESIYWSPLPFPFLKCIDAFDCPKLRKLPLNATSVPCIGEFSIYMESDEEQKAEFEWEDEDTKNRFLPLIDWDY